MVYLTVLIFMGSFFFLNLMLAVIMESYMKAELIEGERITGELKQQKLDFEKLHMNSIVDSKIGESEKF
jgi:hypothetical protein